MNPERVGVIVLALALEIGLAIGMRERARGREPLDRKLSGNFPLEHE